uniref:Uncharacterized protein n=1 Tax=Anguilla anguilla TaxID=7936 RepID=A0A0E9RAM3_ANGAN
MRKCPAVYGNKTCGLSSVILHSCGR